MTDLRICPHGMHHPQPGNENYPHSCDGCWCEGIRDRNTYGWPHDTAPTPDRRNDTMSDTLRTGKLIKSHIYLIIKNPNGPNTDIGHEAPAGTIVHWSGMTNRGSEEYYGGRLLHWIALPEYTSQNIGAELGVDFEWDGATTP